MACHLNSLTSYYSESMRHCSFRCLANDILSLKVKSKQWGISSPVSKWSTGLRYSALPHINTAHFFYCTFGVQGLFLTHPRLSPADQKRVLVYLSREWLYKRTISRTRSPHPNWCLCTFFSFFINVAALLGNSRPQTSKLMCPGRDPLLGACSLIGHG